MSTGQIEHRKMNRGKNDAPWRIIFVEEQSFLLASNELIAVVVRKVEDFAKCAIPSWNGSQSRDNFTELPSTIEESNSVFVESDIASLYRDDESELSHRILWFEVQAES